VYSKGLKINEERINFSKELDREEYLNGIHIDESSIVIDDYKKYGYSESGKEIKIVLKHKQNKERYTLLKAITKEKIIDYELIKGSVNAQIYLDFIKKIMNKDILNKNKTIFQDNARIHHSVIVKEYTKNENIKMKFNPAYTPEFNPIEYIFSKIKTTFRNLEHIHFEESIKKSISTISSIDLYKCYQRSLSNFYRIFSAYII